MKAEQAILEIIRGERRGLAPSAARATLAGLAYLYSAGLKLYLLPYRIGIRRQFRLPAPVISVGNLTVGGTGKTPMTRRVCEMLIEMGLRPAALIRGYRGEHEQGAAIVSTERRVELTAKEAGDEAYLLARLMPGVPVVAGKDRRKTGMLAWERFHPDVFVLDDGMQFYQLHRELDVVLLDAMRPFDNGWTFPRGLLREPPSHLRRAGAVIVTNADRASPEEIDRIRSDASRLAPRALICTARYEPVGLRALDRSAEFPVDWLDGRRIASLCALGNPQGFEAQLERAGATLVSRTRLPDHHEPTMGELQEAISAACTAGAEAIVVTEKDAVKLPPMGRPLPFWSLRVNMEPDDPRGLRAVIERAIAR